MLTRLTVLLPTVPGIGWIGYQGVEQVTSTGPDLQGIALIITSISGLVATVGALVIGLRKKPDDQAAEIVKAILEAQKKDGPQ